jgi:DNA-binding MarR family transcriptional regulator
MKMKKNEKNVSAEQESQGSRKYSKDALSEKETLDLMILMGWTSDIIHKVRQKELSPYGLNRVQAGVLQVIHSNDGKARSNEIPRRMLRERHSVHELLRRMEKLGLIKGIDDARRKNGISFELTSKGRDAYRHVVKRPSQHKIFSRLSRKQREELMASLRALYDAASDILEKSGGPSMAQETASDD